MQPIVTPERREQAQTYARIRYRMILLNFAIICVYLNFLIAGGSRSLGALLPGTVPYVVGLLALLSLITLPVDYYSHLQARRFGISVQSDGSWLLDQIKGFLISLVLQTAMAVGLLAAWGARPADWYLVATVAAVLVSLLLGFVAPVLIMPLFHKYTPLADGELKERLQALSQRAGVFIKGTFVSDVSRKETRLNAAITGIGATRRMILYDTMIQSCTVDEIEVVMGHELGHHAFGHIPKRIALSSLFLAGALTLSGLLLEPASRALGLGGLTKEALPLLAAFLVLLYLLLTPAMQALSRRWERDCDAFALRTTGKPEAFISFFRKVADRNLADTNPPRWVYYFQYSHPPVPERIAAAERFAAGARPR